jgi:hypothetical protein
MSTPKEKAEELVRKYYTFGLNNPAQSFSWYECKQCALITVDEIIESHYFVLSGVKPNIYNFWQEVKQEIEKL